MPDIQLVILDMAGTTVQDEDVVNRIFQEALAGAGLMASRDQINAVMGYPKPVATHLLMTAQQGSASDEAIARVQADFLVRMNHYYATDPTVREVAGASTLFRQLRAAGLRVALDTGFARATVDVILHRLGWMDGLLDATAASDEVERGRPHPDLVYVLMEKTGVTDPARVAKVGDTPSDLQEGTAAGCGLVVGITSGTHTADELRPYPHTHLIARLDELPALLGLD
jgi:phosphonatase-like hydrolase